MSDALPPPPRLPKDLLAGFPVPEDRLPTWVQTRHGKALDVFAPRAEDLTIEDVAHHLALRNRFGGASFVPYSVAEHSVRCEVHARTLLGQPEYAPLVAVLADGTPEGVPPTAALARMLLTVLLHDYPEAFLADVPTSYKRKLQPLYALGEEAFYRAGEVAFGLSTLRLHHPLVLQADRDLLATEFRDLMGPSPAGRDRGLTGTPLAETLVPWSWQAAEDAFLARYYALQSHLVPPGSPRRQSSP